MQCVHNHLKQLLYLTMHLQRQKYSFKVKDLVLILKSKNNCKEKSTFISLKTDCSSA